MKSLIERLFVKVLKLLPANLLEHAHVQIGAGHNTYCSGEEYFVNVILKKILKKDPEVIFDIGANIGQSVILIRATFSEPEIYCFEPVKETFDKLIANTKHLQPINFNNVAVGSTDGTITLFRGSKDEEGSMVTAYKDTLSDVFTFAGEPNTSIICKMITMDDFFYKNNISEIDFLKIDVEGHELEVLKGAKNVISENKINVIQFEFSEFNIFSRSFIYDYYQALPQYKFYRIMPQNKLFPMGKYSSSNEIFKYQNIVAINNSLNFVYQS